MIVRRDRDDRHLLVDQRDRTVLHFPGRVPFGVDVRDFLQLQRSFERNRIVDAATEEQEVGAVVEAFRDLFRLQPRPSASARGCAGSAAALDVPADLGRRQRSAHLGQVEREQLKRHQL